MISEQSKDSKDATVERIRGLMERHNLNVTRAARYFGVPQGTLSNWLAGTRSPTLSVGRLVDVLMVIETMAPVIHDNLLPKK